MKAALIRRQYSATGGAELYLHRLLCALTDAGHELHLFTESWPQAPRGVSVHAVPAGGSRTTRARRFAEAVAVRTSQHTFDCVFSLERTLKQDVYRAGDGVHRVWLKRRRQFAPWWRRPFTGRGAFHKTMLELEAQTFDPRNTRRIIANSEMVKREIVEEFRFPEHNIHVVRNGVDIARFQKGDRVGTRARFGVAPDDFLLLFVGSGWERKGLSYLLAAMHECGAPSQRWLSQFQEGADAARRNAEYLASSDKPRHGRIKRAAEKIKLLVVGKGRRPLRSSRNVIFSGPMAEVENAYAAADLLVFLPIYEPSANVVFEALAARVPVITSALNGASELLGDDRLGTVVSDPSDPEAVARAIGYRWARRGETATIDLNSLSMDRNVGETLAILELAAKEKSQ